MKEIKLSIIINRPAHEIFDFTLNPENTPKWVDGIVQERASQSPTKLGTVYKNQDRDGNWSEFEITAYQPDVMFVMSKRNSTAHVKYSLRPLDDSQSELEYRVWTDIGDFDKRFTQDTVRGLLQKLKAVLEAPNGSRHQADA